MPFARLTTRASQLAAILCVFAVATAEAQQRTPNSAAPRAGQPAARPAAPKPAAAPFQISPQHLQVLRNVLKKYEQETSKIKTFSATLGRLEFDPVWGPKDKERTRGEGILMYTKPDRAKFVIGKVTVYDARKKEYVPDDNAKEHVAVNGKEVILKDYRKKQVIVQPLPKELHGKGIFYGPLPFVFGAKAEDLERRYFMRITTPANVKGQIWLEAHPRFQADAANYKKVDLIIGEKDMLPVAIQVHKPNGKNKTVYTFSNQKVDPFKWNLLSDDYAIRTPLGWKRVVEKPPVAAPVRTANAGRPAPR